MQEHTILILEDSPACQRIAIESVKRIAETKLVASLSEAREFLKSHRVSLVLIDMNLPDGNGLDFYGEMQTTLDLSDVPVIFVTGNEDISKKVAAFSFGAEDYLTKPYSPMELKARVERIFRGKKNQNVFADDLSGVTLDLTRYKATCGQDGNQVELALTPHEFKILYLFLKHPQQIYTRQQIIDHVWGHEVFLTPRTVDVHISSLRKKISPAVVEIVSVRGVGYKSELPRRKKAA